MNNPGTPSSELQINFGVLQIDTENSASGLTVKEDALNHSFTHQGPAKTNGDRGMKLFFLWRSFIRPHPFKREKKGKCVFYNSFHISMKSK